jgi:tRNA 2-selenouridine synthase
LLEALPIVRKIDLEKAAAHRGSAFGQMDDERQPSIASFENRIALKLMQVPTSESSRTGAKDPKVLIEDESRRIGGVTLPETLIAAIQSSEVIELQCDLHERAENLLRDYIERPLANGTTHEALCQKAVGGILKIRKALGGLASDQIINAIEQSFHNKALDREQHMHWISRLLTEYYDKRYQHAVRQLNRPVLYRGDYESCYQWICQKFD